jgi:hypothetical protein
MCPYVGCQHLHVRCGVRGTLCHVSNLATLQEKPAAARTADDSLILQLMQAAVSHLAAANVEAATTKVPAAERLQECVLELRQIALARLKPDTELAKVFEFVPA